MARTKKNNSKTTSTKRTKRTRTKTTDVKAEVNVKSLVAVKMTIRQWGGMTSNNKAAAEVEATHNAETGAVRAMLLLLPKSWQTKLNTAACKLRGEWFKLTLPWEDGGWRVIPSASYEKVMQQSNTLIAEYQKVCDALLTEYPKLVKRAQERLGDLYDGSKFPSRAMLETMFGAYVYQRPIIAGSDVRIEGLSDGAVDTVRSAVEKQIGEQTGQALHALVGRLRELLDDALTRYGKDEQKRVRYGGLQKRVEQTCSALADLNISNNTQVSQLIEDVKSVLTKHDPDDLRNDSKTTSKAKQEAKDTLSVLDSFGM